MSSHHMLTRRSLLRIAGAATGAAALAACVATPTPQVVEKVVKETVVVTQEVEKVVKETVVVEKPVEATPVSGPVKIVWRDWFAADDMVDACKAFTEKYGITAEPQTAGTDEKLIAELVSGTAPDCWGSGAAMHWTYLGACADLTEFYAAMPKEEVEDMWPANIPCQQWQGKWYGVPMDASLPLMYYNRDAYEEAGVALPTPEWTHDDFVAAALALKKEEGGKVTRWGHTPCVHDGWIECNLSWIFQFDTEFIDEELKNSLADDPKTIEAVQWFADLWLKNGVSATADDVAGIGAMTMFFQGQSCMHDVALYGLGSLLNETVAGNIKFKWDIAPLPKGVIAAHQFFPHSVVMNVNTPYKKETWELMHALMWDDDVMPLLYTSGSSIPGRISTMDNLTKYMPPGSADVLPEGAKYIKETIPSCRSKRANFITTGNEHEATLTEALSLVFIGEKTAQEALTEAKPKLQRYIESSKHAGV